MPNERTKKSDVAGPKTQKIILTFGSLWLSAFVVLTLILGFFPYEKVASVEFTGPFGDSFGVFTALMASLAAGFSYQTYGLTKAENENLRRREQEQDERSDILRAEGALFSVFEIRSRLISQMAIGNLSAIKVVDSAAYNLLHGAWGVNTKTYVKERLGDARLAAYLHFSQQIISFIDRSFPELDRRRYYGLFRDQLTDNELLVFAAYCGACDRPRFFKEIFEDNSFLLNAEPETEIRRLLGEFYEVEAFSE